MKKQILIPSLALTDATIRRYRRELPREGVVKVQKGDAVSSDTVVATAVVPGQLVIVRAAQTLNVEPQDVAELTNVKVGDTVEEGQAIASYRGLFGFFSSQCTSPRRGKIEFISSQTGNIGIRLDDTELNLHAHVAGSVIEVIENRGVVIEARGAFIQGVFGVGGERWGRLKALPVPADGVVRRSNLPDNISGCVLFGGATVTTGALTLAAERGAVGVITGSIDDETLSAYVGHQIGVAVTGDEDIPLTVIVSEGFGLVPINQRLFKLLKKYEGSLVAINGATQVRAGAVRPEAMIFHEVRGLPAEVEADLKIDARVRLIRHPYFGQLGTVTALPAQPQLIATGAHARVLEVKLENGELVSVPRANAELVPSDSASVAS